ncbi:spore germination protein [Paenibacillus sp. CN-4]|uniref:spore germination protein n=1 Tax=Paenibacillus nanchangensis TaxID=3348343 RepID=UPI0039791956
MGQEEGGEAAQPPPAGTDNTDDSSGTEEDGDAGGKEGRNENRQAEDSEEEPKKSRRERRRKSKKRKAADPLQEKRDTERSDSIKESVVYWQGDDRIPEKLEDLKGTLTEVVGLGSSFDLVYRAMRFGERDAALVFISGFAKDVILDEILKRLTYLSPDNVSTDAIDAFVLEYIPHIQVERGTELSVALAKMLSGYSLLFIDGESVVVMMDTRNYPVRSPDEPTIERVVRGSRDGFTETLMTNVALVRRRIRDPGLRFETSPVGRRSRTDVSVAYIDDIADKTQVKAVKDKLKEIDVDGIPLADKQLEEAIIGRGWHPYPMVRYSERPDVVASHLLEGRVVLFVDTSPSVIITPTTFFDLCQHAEENRQTPFMGSYLRWVRFAGIFASMFLLPLWLLLVIHPELKPPMLDFIGPHENAKIPLLAQFLMIEFGVDLLRMAAVHTPTPLGSAMGLIAAILIGDIAVQTGLFVNEVVLYMAVAAIGMFATPSYELGLANRVVRLALLILAAAFQVPGFMIGTTALILLLTVHRSYNSSYLWPFIPFNAKAIGAILLRQPLLSSGRRPSFNKTRDNTRIGRKQGGKQ